MQKTYQKKPGDYLRELRIAQKWKQVDLAIYSKLSQAEISNLETGSANFTEGVISHLMKAFAISREELIRAIHLKVMVKANEEIHHFNNDEAQIVFSQFQKLNMTEDCDERKNLFERFALSNIERIEQKKKLATVFQKKIAAMAFIFIPVEIILSCL